MVYKWDMSLGFQMVHLMEAQLDEYWAHRWASYLEDWLDFQWDHQKAILSEHRSGNSWGYLTEVR